VTFRRRLHRLRMLVRRQWWAPSAIACAANALAAAALFVASEPAFMAVNVFCCGVLFQSVLAKADQRRASLLRLRLIRELGRRNRSLRRIAEANLVLYANNNALLNVLYHPGQQTFVFTRPTTESRSN
jgi:hypothetical protein